MSDATPVSPLPRQQSLNHVSITEHIDDFLARIIALEQKIEPLAALFGEGSLVERLVTLENQIKSLVDMVGAGHSPGTNG
jgi:hypothetical protein